MAVVVLRQMHGAKAAPANLLFDDVLIDAVDGCAVVIVAAPILRLGIECLLHTL